MAVSKTEDLEAQWYAEMENKAKGLDEETSGLASVVIGLSRLNYYGGQEDESKACMEQLRTLAGGRTEGFYEPLLTAVRKLFSPYTAEVMTYIVEHCTEYPYSRGYVRRPYRTRNLELHSAQILSKLSSLIFMERQGFVLGEYLRKKDNDTDYNVSYRFRLVLSDVIAYELDREDSSGMLDDLKEMVYGDNQAAVLSYEVIKGVFMSHRKEAVVMLGELLLAAKLQEGCANRWWNGWMKELWITICTC